MPENHKEEPYGSSGGVENYSNWNDKFIRGWTSGFELAEKRNHELDRTFEIFQFEEQKGKWSFSE